MAISSSNRGAQPGVCTSTTRPSAPYEGQMVYETDTDMVAIWNGSAWRYIAATTPTSGTVLQVVNSSYDTQVTAGSSTWVDTGLTASITPKSSSSKVLVMVAQCGIAKSAAADAYAGFRLLRGSTVVTQFALSSGYTGDATANRIGSDSTFWLDSPATTSATTYKTQMNNSGGAGTVYCQVNSGSNASTMVLMEIAG